MTIGEIVASDFRAASIFREAGIVLKEFEDGSQYTCSSRKQYTVSYSTE
jgi:hypothetical protein